MRANTGTIEPTILGTRGGSDLRSASGVADSSGLRIVFGPDSKTFVARLLDEAECGLGTGKTIRLD